MLVGYIAVIVAVATFGMAGVMVLVSVLKGVQESKNKPEIPDPLEGDPAVVSTKLPPLPAEQMNPIEATSTKAPLLVAVGTLVVLAVIFVFSGYGFKEMGNSARTTATIRKEAKLKAQKQREMEAGLTLEEDEGATTKKASATFQIKPTAK